MRANEYFGDLEIQAVFDRVFDPNHIHLPLSSTPGYYSLEMIAEGEVELRSDDERMILKGPCIFWNKDTCRLYHFRGRHCQYRHLWIDYIGARGKRIHDFLCKRYPERCIAIPADQVGRILDLYQEIGEWFFSGDGYDPNEMTVKFEQLICLITTENSDARHVAGDPYRIYQVWEMIRHNPFYPYSQAELAADRRISEVYFRLLFQRRFKIPFQRFLQQSRLDYAAMLLLKSHQYRINELADMCGFANVSGFSNAFYRRFGMFPREYQRNGGFDKNPETDKE